MVDRPVDGCSGRIRTDDLLVMSQVSYLLLHAAKSEKATNIAAAAFVEGTYPSWVDARLFLGEQLAHFVGTLF